MRRNSQKRHARKFQKEASQAFKLRMHPRSNTWKTDEGKSADTTKRKRGKPTTSDNENQGTKEVETARAEQQIFLSLRADHL